MLFDSILNSQYFVKTSIILFLNKVDIFKSQILISSINDYFPDYLGEQTDFVAAKEFFRKRFIKLNRNVGRKEVCKFFFFSLLSGEEEELMRGFGGGRYEFHDGD